MRGAAEAKVAQMPAKPRLLRTFIKALYGLGYDELAPKLERSFELVAQKRPDLLTRGLFAERGRNTVQLEAVVRAALEELEIMAAAASSEDEICAPGLSNLRFNHATGKLHLGHGYHWVYLFPPPET